MKNIRLPKKSILGFKILNSFHSSFFAYFFLLIRFLFINLYSNFGNLSKSSIASALLFILIINFSIFILILNSILKSKFTISTSGDRDDCYRHYECIGLNSIPISNINYREIFGNNMIYSDIDNIIEMINETKIIGYNQSNNYINPDILLIDYWRDKIQLRLK